MRELTEQKIDTYPTTHFQKAYEELLQKRPGILASESGGELEWLKDARERDFGRWAAEGLPTKKSEKWMYTSLSSLAELPIALPGPVTDFKAWDSSARKGQSDSEVVFLNGQYSPSLSKIDPTTGVSIVILSELLKECVEGGWSSERIVKFTELRRHVESSDADRENVFAAMNTSFMEDGILIQVAEGVRLEKPIVLSFLTDSLATTMVSPRIFIHLDPRSQASFLEVYEGREGQKYFSNTVSDIRVEEGAHLSFCKVQLESHEAFHIGTTRIQQARSSFAEAFQFSFGARLSRQDLRISLNGEGAETSMDGLYMMGGQQHVDNHTAVEHVLPQTSSSQVYKGVLGGRARAVFNGFVRIHPNAQKANAKQLNNNLMTSDRAEVDTKPELEIDADDVKAAHGASVGRIDPEHVFYLQTRGIPRREAVRLLALGFAKDVVFRIRNREIRRRLEALVEDQFKKVEI